MEVAWLGRPPAFSPRRWALFTSFIPGPLDTLLLRAALGPADIAKTSWREWTGHVGDPVRAIGTDARHIKVLVPLLAHNLRRSNVETSAAFQTYARAATLTETLRMTGFMKHTGRVLDELNRADIPHVVLKGAALAAHVYGDIAYRHAHDLDILIASDRLHDAEALLRQQGFAPTTPVGADHHHLSPLANAVGFSVELHRRLRNQYPGLTARDVIRRSQAATVADRATRIPSLADALLHVAVHATACTSSNLRWACDAWLIAGRMTPADWAEFGETTRSASLALPALLTLGYLEDAIGQVVPRDVMATIAELAVATDRFGRDAATFSARASLPLDLDAILTLPGGWRARVDQVAWRLFPPRRHIYWMHGLRRPWLAPLYYPYRLLKLPARMVRWGLSGFRAAQPDARIGRAALQDHQGRRTVA